MTEKTAGDGKLPAAEAADLVGLVRYADAAVVSRTIAQRDRSCVLLPFRLIHPRDTPFVAMLVHWQSPFHATRRQPPVLLAIQRPPVGWFQYRVPIEDILLGRLEGTHVQPAAQFREKGQAQIAIFQHHSLEDAHPRFWTCSIVRSTVEPDDSKVVPRVYPLPQIRFVRIAGQRDAGLVQADVGTPLGRCL